MKHAAAAELIRQAEGLGVSLDEGIADRLLALERLLLDRAVPKGLIARTDAHRVRTRHVLDCLRAVRAIERRDETAYDLGSGAGLPGLVVAIAAPALQIRLVDVRRRKAAFAELAIERLGLANASVEVRRIEELGDPVDLCFARALAPLPEAWTLAERVLRPEGRLVYFAGARARAPFWAPGARCVATLSTPVLERSGPLVIMAR